MSDDVILITGANGEIGHGLITCLGEQGNSKILALDLHPIDESLQPYCYDCMQADILDELLLEHLFREHGISTIYHLASILSTKAELNPELAHRINIEGTLNLLKLASDQSRRFGQAVKFLYPSSIAIYGMPSVQVKQNSGPVREDEYNQPGTMYGCNKLYCENLGRYYSTRYRQLSIDFEKTTRIDFRALRFPGLISAVTVPTGGTSDYGPEMLHYAAQGAPYACFVREDTQLPFMVMPDAIRSLLLLGAAPRKNLQRFVYNVTSFHPTADDIKEITLSAFPQSKITFEPSPARQSIVDSWPAMIDDSAARQDWGWTPEYSLKRAFSEYLIPAIQKRYSGIKVK
ncbi:MAG: GDP-mannose 4,6-dehydratase [Anaerolineaceae bacterium]|nr:GDP-mannose 4,6-dehydratase [Anaerolineaceae bacterium]